jgi:hypothetical protein
VFGFILSLALTASPTPTLDGAFYGSSTAVGIGASRPERSWAAMCSKLLGWNERNFGLSGSAVVGGDVPSALDRLNDLGHAALAGDRLAVWSEPGLLGGFRQGSHLSSALTSPGWAAAEPRAWQHEANALAPRAL